MKTAIIKIVIINMLLMMGSTDASVLREINIARQKFWDSNDNQEVSKKQDAEKFKTYFYLLHYYNHLNEPYTLNWHLSSMQAKFKSKKITYMGFINYGQVLDKTVDPFQEIDMQYRLDAYPILGDHNYAYFSYAYSASNIFPSHQVRGIFYHQFGKGYETSLGMYYMKWDKPFIIYTGSIAKYYENYWFSLRPYFQFKEGSLYQSYLLFARRYFNNPEDYLNLMIGYGSSPEDQSYLYNYESIYSMKSLNFQLNYQKNISHWLFILGAGIKFEEYTESETRNHLHFEIGISYKL